MLFCFCAWLKKFVLLCLMILFSYPLAGSQQTFYQIIPPKLIVEASKAKPSIFLSSEAKLFFIGCPLLAAIVSGVYLGFIKGWFMHGSIKERKKLFDLVGQNNFLNESPKGFLENEKKPGVPVSSDLFFTQDDEEKITHYRNNPDTFYDDLKTTFAQNNQISVPATINAVWFYFKHADEIVSKFKMIKRYSKEGNGYVFSFQETIATFLEPALEKLQKNDPDFYWVSGLFKDDEYKEALRQAFISLESKGLESCGSLPRLRLFQSESESSLPYFYGAENSLVKVFDEHETDLDQAARVFLKKKITDWYELIVRAYIVACKKNQTQNFCRILVNEKNQCSNANFEAICSWVSEFVIPEYKSEMDLSNCKDLDTLIGKGVILQKHNEELRLADSPQIKIAVDGFCDEVYNLIKNEAALPKFNSTGEDLKKQIQKIVKITFTLDDLDTSIEIE